MTTLLLERVADSNSTEIPPERSRFDVRLLLPHILLATVLVLLLILSFIQYHIKYKRKQSHAQYQEYLQLVQRSRLQRRVSIPMTKVMRRFSQGQSLGNQVFFQDGQGHVIGVLHKLGAGGLSSQSDAILSSNHAGGGGGDYCLEDSIVEFQQKRASSVSLPPTSGSGRNVSFYFPADNTSVNDRTELTNNYV